MEGCAFQARTASSPACACAYVPGLAGQAQAALHTGWVPIEQHFRHVRQSGHVSVHRSFTRARAQSRPGAASPRSSGPLCRFLVPNASKILPQLLREADQLLPSERLIAGRRRVAPLLGALQAVHWRQRRVKQARNTRALQGEWENMAARFGAARACSNLQSDPLPPPVPSSRLSSPAARTMAGSCCCRGAGKPNRHRRHAQPTWPATSCQLSPTRSTASRRTPTTLLPSSWCLAICACTRQATDNSRMQVEPALGMGSPNRGRVHVCAWMGGRVGGVEKRVRGRARGQTAPRWRLAAPHWHTHTCSTSLEPAKRRASMSSSKRAPSAGRREAGCYNSLQGSSLRLPTRPGRDSVQPLVATACTECSQARCQARASAFRGRGRHPGRAGGAPSLQGASGSPKRAPLSTGTPLMGNEAPSGWYATGPCCSSRLTQPSKRATCGTTHAGGGCASFGSANCRPRGSSAEPWLASRPDRPPDPAGQAGSCTEDSHLAALQAPPFLGSPDCLRQGSKRHTGLRCQQVQGSCPRGRPRERVLFAAAAGAAILRLLQATLEVLLDLQTRA
jgi:hypothetical protein